jgi:hypothetical protein
VRSGFLLDELSGFFTNSTPLSGSESGEGLLPRQVLRLFRTRDPGNNSAGKRKERKNHESIDSAKTTISVLRRFGLSTTLDRISLSSSK